MSLFHKRIACSPSMSYRSFVQRHQVASALHHRNLIAILDISEDHDRPYVVFEHFVGDSLRSIIDDEAPFVIDDVAILIEQLARGLDHAHKRGIVHGGLSPEDVIVDASGMAKIANLGMIEGQYLLESASRADLESNRYLPSGLAGNTITTSALDVHALASIAYEMLTGRPPDREHSEASDGRSAPSGGYLHPSWLNSSIPERAGDVVVQGLVAYDQRTGLTAMQFSQALTNWRSMTVVAPTRERYAYGSTSADTPHPDYPRRSTWPAPNGQSITNTNGSGYAPPTSTSPARTVRWLFIVVIVWRPERFGLSTALALRKMLLPLFRSPTS